MLSRLLGPAAFRTMILTGYCVLAAGLPFSKIPLSLATMWLVLLTLLEARFSDYLKALKNSKIAITITVLFIWTLCSFCWSDDLHYASQDLITKLPLFILPLIFIIHPVEKLRHLRIILAFFLFSVLVTSLINMGSYFHLWNHYTYSDSRNISLFLSHIRYGLMISISSVIAYFWFRKSASSFRWGWFAIFLWFLVYTYFSQVLSGVVTELVVLFCICLYELKIYRSRKRIAIFASVCILAAGSLFYSLYSFFTDTAEIPEYKDLPVYTAKGNTYHHDLTSTVTENGYPLLYYINEQELKEEWDKVSVIPYEGKDAKQQEIRYTIIRYMTSKGLRKDAEGLQQLTSEDIRNIEQGISTVLHFEKGIKGRLYKVRDEITYNHDPNGHGILQRFLYWKAGAHIFKENLWIGTGSGDIQHAFDTYYDETNSSLKPENRRRTHNQYLTYAASLGISGLLIFLYLLGCLFKEAIQKHSVPGFIILAILCISFVAEDTLETQMGVTLFAFFAGLIASYSGDFRASAAVHSLD